MIVHLAALTNVDACETQRDIADKINHVSVRELSRYLEVNKKVFLLYISTDYVFDGVIGNYSEASPTNPINWYGKTKLMAEQELLESNSKNWCIARTSTPFGVHNKKQSFPIFVLNNLRAGQKIRVLTDQITSPTYSGNLAQMLVEIIKKKIRGVIHTASSSQISRFDQAVKIASLFGLNKELIMPSTMKEMNWKAARPIDSSLSVNLASNILSNKPIDFERGVIALKADLQ